MQGAKQSLWPRLLMIIALIITLFSGIVIGGLNGSMLYMPAVLIAGAFLVLFTIRYEKLPFFLLVSLLYIESFVSIWSGPSPIFISLAILSIANLMVRMAIGNHKFIFDKRTAILAVALGVWVTLSAINAGGVSEIFAGARSFWFLIVFFILIQNYVIKIEDFIQFSWTLVISLGLLSSWAFLNVSLAYSRSGFSMSGTQLHSYIARIVDSAPLFLWMAVGIPFALYLLFLPQDSEKKYQRYLLIYFLFSLISGIIAFFSVSGTFALILTLMMWFLIYPRFSARVKVFSALFITLLFAYLVLWSPFSDRVEQQLTTVESGELTEFGSGRGLAWYIGWQATKEAPILGLGPNMNYILKYSQPYLPQDIINEKIGKGRSIPGLHPHNLYLTMSALVGIPGLLLFLSLVFSILFPLTKKIVTGFRGDTITTPETRYLGYAIFVSLTVFLFQALAVGVFIDKYLWLMLGVGISYLQLTSAKS